MGSTYEEISIEEFRVFIEEHKWGFQEEDVRGTNEVCFALYSVDKKIRMIIYSSIPKTIGVARKRGADAIRVVLMRLDPIAGIYFPIRKLSRVHRTKNWRININARIHEAAKQVHKERCQFCGDILVLRKGVNGEFYSCFSWSKTGCQGKAKV